MNLAELTQACARSRKNARDCGLDEVGARLVLVIPGERKRERARVLPGVMGRVVGSHTETGGKPVTMVDVLVVDVERYLKRLADRVPVAAEDRRGE